MFVIESGLIGLPAGLGDGIPGFHGGLRLARELGCIPHSDYLDDGLLLVFTDFTSFPDFGGLDGREPQVGLPGTQIHVDAARMASSIDFIGTDKGMLAGTQNVARVIFQLIETKEKKWWR